MRLFNLSLLSFVFITTSALSFPRQNISYEVQSTEAKKLTPLPVLSEVASFPIISAQGVLATDLDSGVILYEKNPDVLFFPASTTKIVTALVAMDFYSPGAVLTVGNARVEGQRMGLVSGEKITVNDLLHGLLMFSANDAAEVLAGNFPGGKDSFVAFMNSKTQQLNLENTYLSNPSGLDGIEQVTTARDLVRVSAIAMQDPYFAQIVGTQKLEVKSVDGKIKHKLENLNELVGDTDGVLGVKTGWTEVARENLVTYIERDERRVMIVLLGSQDRFGETKELIEWIFGNYKWLEVSYP